MRMITFVAIPMPKRKSRRKRATREDTRIQIANSSLQRFLQPLRSLNQHLRAEYVLFDVSSNIMDAEDRRQRDCPLRRVQLWHTIPFCLLAIINLSLIIVALLGLARYKITLGPQRIVVEMMRSDLEVELHAEGESKVDTNGGTLLEYQTEMNSETK